MWSALFCLASADNSLYLLYNSLYFSYSVHVATIAACFQRSAALLGVLAFMAAAVHACICCLLAFMAAAVHACICCLLAFMAAAVHACICCLLLPEASHLWCFICLWIDIDYSKFQPRSVSHRKAVRRAHHRHRLVLQTIFL